MDGRCGIGRPAERFGSDEADPLGTESAGGLGVSDECGNQLRPLGRPEGPGQIDPVAKAEEDRLVDDRLEAVAGHDGDEEMHRVGTDVDPRGGERAGPEDRPHWLELALGLAFRHRRLARLGLARLGLARLAREG